MLFVVDRHDLDTQTQSEYEAFEPGAVDNTDNTYELIKHLADNSKIIITTIQKLNAAVTKEYYNKRLQYLRDKRFVFIFDECHRSQFGQSHRNIVRFFRNNQIFGFTGTPIFEENAKDMTTAEIFGEALHKYLIKDAIADDNVLGFLVEYYTGTITTEVDSESRMREIARFILNNFPKSTFDGEFDALFAIQSVPMLLRYYKIFKELNPKIRIGAIFTYSANSSQDDDQTGMNQGFADNKVAVDELQEIMNDYNRMFDTSFTTDNFSAYYDDINLRMKKKRSDMKSLDLLLVVGMFLTGFDSKKLNTLYVDKNLEYHGLLQAFSRTNRVLNEKKRFGKIICFRDIKDKVDTAIRMFSCSDNPEFITRPPYFEVKKEYMEMTEKFLDTYPFPASVDSLKSEIDKRNFVLAFRDIIKKHAEMQIYEDYCSDDAEFSLPEQEFMDFRSKYLDIAQNFGAQLQPILVNAADPEAGYGDAGQSLEDIDFCLELLHSDIINVAYILGLIYDLNPESDDYTQKRKEILDMMIRDSEMRNKSGVIDGFIRRNVDNDRERFVRDKADGSLDLEMRLLEYIKTERDSAVLELAEREDLPVEVLDSYIKEFDYLHKSKPEIIQQALKSKHLGLLKTRRAVKRIIESLTDIIKTFNWD